MDQDDYRETRQPFDGLSTDSEVELLLDKYGDLQPGDLAKYEDVENLIGSKKESVRFWTVTGRWRRLYEQATGIIIGCSSNDLAFAALTAPQRVQYVILQSKKSRRRNKRAHDVAVRTNINDLSIKEREINSKVAYLSGAMKQAYNLEIRRLATAAPMLAPNKRGKTDENVQRKTNRGNSAANAPRQSQLRRQLESLANKPREHGQER